MIIAMDALILRRLWLNQTTDMNKQTKYRRKMAECGRCPHCGKPCEPYYACDERRKAQRDARNKGKNKRHTDAMIIPRINHKPAIYDPDFIQCMEDCGVTVTTESFIFDQ